MMVNEIFGILAARQAEGMMLHNDLADYYDFLGFQGFKRLHEYHFLREAMDMRGTHRYYLGHYNELLEVADVSAKSAIPEAWHGYRRKDVGADAKREAVKSCTEKWLDWEKDTKDLYESMAGELVNAGEMSAARMACNLADCAEGELKCADRLHGELASVGYDLCHIYTMQGELHKKYKKKTKMLEVEAW